MSQYQLICISPTWPVILLILFASHNLQAGQGGWIDDCQPCKFSISPDKKPYIFTFNLGIEGGDSVFIKSISVASPANKKPAQVLPIDFMTPTIKGEQFYFEVIDINFDGFNDLLLIVAMGSANSYAKYWLYNPASKQFDYLDEFPIFKIDETTRSLSTYERGGHGGMIYERKFYKFVNKKLVVVRAEKQEWVEDKKIYLNTVKILKNDVLTFLKKTKIQPAKR